MLEENHETPSGDSADPRQASTWLRAPSRLRTPPTLSQISPPVETLHQVLPTDLLAWEDFERLCLRLMEINSDVVHVREVHQPEQVTAAAAGIYGTRGQAQSGIDVYARDPLILGAESPQRRYVCLQARRTATVTQARLRDSVNVFLAGKWADVSRKFIYATSASATSVHTVDEIEELATLMVTSSIEFEVWDQEHISKKLKDEPEVVHDFFGRQWVKVFCGEAAADALRQRLDAMQIAELRRELAKVYAASFGVADSGLIVFKLTDASRVSLTDRFVTPSLASITPQTASLQHTLGGLDQFDPEPDAFHDLFALADPLNTFATDDNAWLNRSRAQNRRFAENPQIEDRKPADQWIGREALQIIVGDPGAGKSTLLRFLVLDLLRREPTWAPVAERWGQRLPVWLPFHFFTQRVAGNTGSPASVSSALKAWLEQHDAVHVWPLVQKALDDQRLLLVVDGLDEWVDDQAGRAAVAALEVFATARSIPLVVSSRPYGLSRLTLSGDWNYQRIAPLTPEQQRALAIHYFRAVLDTDTQSPTASVVDRSVDDFLSQVRDAADLRAISGNPLFLVLLVGLHLSNSSSLPVERFQIYDEALKLLIADHPANRRAAASVTTPRQSESQKLSDRQRRTLLGQVAFVNQIRGDVAAVEETTLRRDFVEALCDRDFLAMVQPDAVQAAEDIVDVVEGELGILVRKGPTDLGFLHRVFQEQLTAEFITDRLEPHDVNQLFADHVGDPRWREVLLATMWRINRPAELRVLLDVIQSRIDETPAGMYAREIFAEVIFGPYGIPATDIEKRSSSIIDAIEGHPYDPHRARLLDSVLAGIEGVATQRIVQACLERWTVLTRHASEELIWAVAQLPPGPKVSELVCRLLLLAIQQPSSWIAYASASAIADRCSAASFNSAEERNLLRSGLLSIVSNPPSGLSQGAAVAALALEWRDDPSVIEILHQAREHTQDGVRLVSLCDVLGVLRTTLLQETPSGSREYPRELSDLDREWLVDLVVNQRLYRWDISRELLVAATSEAVRDQHAVLSTFVEVVKDAENRHHVPALVWSAMLRAFADHESVVDIVCDLLGSERIPHFFGVMTFEDDNLLQLAYPPSSPHSGRIAAAIENRLGWSPHGIDERRLFLLAPLDHGPRMKQALLRALDSSNFPHGAALALVEYFGDHQDVLDTLRAELMGDAIRASTIANVASKVLNHEELIPRLLEILRYLQNVPATHGARADFVVSAVISAYREQGIPSGLELGWVAEQILALTPATAHPLSGDQRYDVAAEFYPSSAPQEKLAELAGSVDRPLEPYLRVFKDDPDQLEPLLTEASSVLGALPPYLRARVCQFLADRHVSASLAMRLTSQWADEVSDLNKSVASLAFHRALLRARQEKAISDDQWEEAMANLPIHASAQGFDGEARQRSALVGMCVCADWSMAERLIKTGSEPTANKIPLVGLMSGPDRTMLQQLASKWPDLRAEFGEQLFDCFTAFPGSDNTNSMEYVWEALALVAMQNEALQADLEKAVADNPDLLRMNGVVAWFIARATITAEEVFNVLDYRLRKAEHTYDELIPILAMECERRGVAEEDLHARLQKARDPAPDTFEGHALESLAILFPDDPAVAAAWREYSSLELGDHPSHGTHLNFPAYLAVAYGNTSAPDFVQRMERHLSQLEQTVGWHWYSVFTRCVSRRLRHDPEATNIVREFIMDPATPDSRAVLLLALLSDAVGLDERLLNEVQRRISLQDEIQLAPVLRDPVALADLSVTTIFTRIADSAWDIRAS